MKKFISLIMILSGVLLLCACGEAEIVIEADNVTEIEVEYQDDGASASPEAFEAAGNESAAAEESAAPETAYEKAEKLVKEAESREAAMDFDNPELTQADMNTASSKLYESWDLCLNEIWKLLKENLPDDEMKAITTEEVQWIKDKEAASEAEAKKAEGGTLYPTLKFTKAAELTRERVYVLLEYLK